MQIETWKPIKDYEGWYEVSDLGNVRRLRKATGAKEGKILTPLANGSGYHSVALSMQCKVKMFLIHRLVAEAFLAPDPDRLFVNHKDGNRQNNTLSNLEWCTAKENSKHSKNVLHNHRKLKPDDVVEIRRAYKEDHLRLEDLAKRYNVGRTLISKVVTRTLWNDVPGDALPKIVEVTQDTPEVWKVIEHAKTYSISNYGNLRNDISGFMLTPSFDKINNNLQARIVNAKKPKNVTIARLVAEAFIGPANGRLVNHKNGDKKDNRVNNLEYVAHGGCIRRAIRNSGGQHRT